MPLHDPRHWSPFLPFDPEEGTIIRNPPGDGPGYWAGAPGIVYDGQDARFHIVYRLRRPRGVEPDRGGEIRIASSRDGILFNDIWSGTKDQLGTTSIERCALVRNPDNSWRLYVSYVDPDDNRWRIGMTEAQLPDAFDLSTVRPVVRPSDLGIEGVKDPIVFNIGGLTHMIVSYATKTAAETTTEAMHGTSDVFNTGLIQSATGLLTSVDGTVWRWEGLILSPSQNSWDSYCARIGTIWYQKPVWLALYDGSADVTENYEERCGLAYSSDFRSFQRVTRDAPIFQSPHATGSIRYFDVLAIENVTYFYYEMARADGAHELRVFRQVIER